MRHNWGIVAGVCLSISAACAQLVKVDPSFAPQIDGRIASVLVQPDGKILIGGYFTNVNGIARPRLARLNSDGSLDESFVPQLWNSPRAFVWGLQLAGTNLYVQIHDEWLPLPCYVGTASAGDWVIRSSLSGAFERRYVLGARFTVDSQRRLLWGTSEVLCRYGGPYVRYYQEDDTNTCSQILAYLGCLGGNGYRYSGVYTFALQQQHGEEKILIGGFFGHVNSNALFGLARLNSDGSVDTTFQTNNRTIVTALTVTPDGKIYVGSMYGSLRRAFADGTPDPGFISDPLKEPSTADPIVSIVPQADGGILVVHSGYSPKHSYLRRLNPDGTSDTNFLVQTSDARVFPPWIAQYVENVALQSDGGILIAGQFTRANCSSNGYLARLVPSAQPAPVECFIPPTKPEPAFVTTILPQRQIVVNWQAGYPEYTLQATRVLHRRHPEKEKWVTVTNEPVCDELGCWITNKLSRYGKHYRLVKP